MPPATRQRKPKTALEKAEALVWQLAKSGLLEEDTRAAPIIEFFSGAAAHTKIGLEEWAIAVLEEVPGDVVVEFCTAVGASLGKVATRSIAAAKAADTVPAAQAQWGKLRKAAAVAFVRDCSMCLPAPEQLWHPTETCGACNGPMPMPSDGSVYNPQHRCRQCHNTLHSAGFPCDPAAREYIDPETNMWFCNALCHGAAGAAAEPSPTRGSNQVILTLTLTLTLTLFLKQTLTRTDF
jgi:hypothetical protein